MSSLLHLDGLHRCPWPGQDPFYVAYHDDEWGVPEYDDRALYEKLMLDGFQAGLSWITILRKREAFRAAFDQFDPEKIGSYDRAKVDALMQNSPVPRTRALRQTAPSLEPDAVRLGRQGPGLGPCPDLPLGRPLRMALAAAGG